MRMKLSHQQKIQYKLWIVFDRVSYRITCWCRDLKLLFIINVWSVFLLWFDNHNRYWVKLLLAYHDTSVKQFCLLYSITLFLISKWFGFKIQKFILPVQYTVHCLLPNSLCKSIYLHYMLQIILSPLCQSNDDFIQMSIVESSWGLTQQILSELIKTSSNQLQIGTYCKIYSASRWQCCNISKEQPKSMVYS